MGYVERNQVVFGAIEIVDQAADTDSRTLGVAVESHNRFVVDGHGLDFSVAPVDFNFGFRVNSAYSERERHVVLYLHGNVVVGSDGDEYGRYGYILRSSKNIAVDALAVHLVVAHLITFGRRGGDVGRYTRFELVVFDCVQFVCYQVGLREGEGSQFGGYDCSRHRAAGSTAVACNVDCPFRFGSDVGVAGLGIAAFEQQVGVGACTLQTRESLIHVVEAAGSHTLVVANIDGIDALVIVKVKVGKEVVGAPESCQVSVLAQVYFGKQIVATLERKQVGHVRHVQFGQLVAIAREVGDFAVSCQIEPGQLVVAAYQVHQGGIGKYIQFGQIVVVAEELFEFGILGQVD